MPLRVAAIGESVLGVFVTGSLSLVSYARLDSVWAAIITMAICGSLWGFLADRRIRYVRRVLFVVHDIAGDLDKGIAVQPIDEARLGAFAPLGRGFNALLRSLSAVSDRVGAMVSQAQRHPERILATMAEFQTSTDRQEEAVEEAASLIVNMKSSMAMILERVEALTRVAEESASSILEMGSSIDEVAHNAASLHESTEASTASVHEMGSSIRQVADAAAHVEGLAEETASSMAEMDRVLRDVSDNVAGASSLTEQVSEDAQESAKAVSETIADIERIHDRISQAQAGQERLVGRIGEIGSILDVIGEINEEAKLLSLNAAIIAAQAGERGKAFLVVANHVKELARRTASSTEEIGTQLASVQGESNNAVAAMGAGIEAIEQGVSRSRVAGKALERILESSAEATSRVSEISRASAEQIHTSGAVSEAAQRTSEQVRQISEAIKSQSAAAEQVLRSAEASLHLCQHVHRSTDEQRETGRYITNSINSITEMTRAIQESAASHDTTSKEVSEAVGRLLTNAQSSRDQLPLIRSLLEELQVSAQEITQELDRFGRAAEEA